jgi:hypothetical protein
MKNSFRRYGFTIKSRLPQRSSLTSKPFCCIAAACFMVILRIISFDYRYFFSLRSVPDHDMYQGASFFTTSMHSMRLNGDIVWWNPAYNNGYAQYYQSFFSPLAPTSNHIIFILWAQGIRLLSILGITIPEYFQYLTINYIVFPFLAFLALAAFCTLLFERFATVFLVLTVYTFSGIGLWNSAWFYFQEPFNLFFLLATTVGALQRPNLRRLLLFLIAVIVQVTAANYWTIYNAWFIGIIVVSYWLIYPNQFRRLYLRIARLLRQSKLRSTIVLGVSTLVMSLWLVILLSIVVEQSSSYIRSAGEFSVLDAYQRVKELRTFTTELFDPDIYRALQTDQGENPMHHARYIGAFLLPFLALIPFYEWRRREKFLIVSTIGVLCICVAPPILLALWEAIPFMDKIRHLFYFYTQYWQFLVTLLAAMSFDNIIRRRYSKQVRKKFTLIIYGLLATSAIGTLLYSLFSSLFPANDRSLQSNLYFFLMVGIVCVCVLQILNYTHRRNPRLLIALVLILAVTDLTRYFWDVSLLDNAFTTQRWGGIQSPLSASAQAALSNPWPTIDTRQGFDAELFNNMPIRNDVWPINTYIYHRYLDDISQAPDVFQNRSLKGPSFDFYTSIKAFSTPESIKFAFENRPGALLNNKELITLSGPATSDGDYISEQSSEDVRLDVANPNLWQLSGMRPTSPERNLPNTWSVSNNPNMQFKPLFNFCFSDYSYIYTRMAISSDIVSPTLQIYYQIDGDARFTEQRSVSLQIKADGKPHAYAIDVARLPIAPKARLTGIRIDPVFNGARTGKSWVEIQDFRLIHGDQSNTCDAQPAPTAVPAGDTSFAYTWNEWRYNTFGIDLKAPQAGWLLIRQLYDPLWKLTLDGKPVTPIRANFVGMAIAVPEGAHQLRMDYRPFARSLYWPASILLEVLLIVLFAMALRKGTAA